jgi:hypothetical protein
VAILPLREQLYITIRGWVGLKNWYGCFAEERKSLPSTRN